MYRLILQLNQQSQKVFELGEGEIILGRESSANIYIPDPSVSRRHARVFFSGGQYFVEDLGSSNGTRLNGQLVHGPQTLKPGDEIHLGPAIALRFDGPPPAPAAPPVAATMNVGADRVPQTPVNQAAGGPGFSLLVQVGSEPAQVIPLAPGRYSLGRAPDNQIVIDSRIVSRQHAFIEVTPQGVLLQPSPQAGNPITLNGQPVTQPMTLQSGQTLLIAGPDPNLRVEMRLIGPGGAGGRVASTQYAPVPNGPPPAGGPAYPVAAAQTPPVGAYPAGAPAVAPLAGTAAGVPAMTGYGPRTRRVEFQTSNMVTVGRDPTNTIVLDHPTVSRFHAQIERVGERYKLRDLNSANGTFVCDRPVVGEVWINPSDHVRIGPYRFVVAAEGLAQIDETGGLRIDAVGLNKWVRKDLNLLQDISLTIKPREFVVVVGQSGGGKSTLVDALAGYRPAGDGKVYVNGIDIYENFEAVRSEIGYVPQRDIIHMELTVYQALDYSARLRMPRDTSPEERRKRIHEVLKDLDLEHRKDVQISRLSGGQQKRVSIGVELLTRPGLFYLDEPTSGLDPGGETALMQLMRKLADQGRTIILVTHATKNVMMSDKVIFLARGGFLAWFGPPGEALTYFDQYRTPEERAATPMEFDKIYALLEDSKRGGPKDWAERFMSHPAYKQYIIEPLAQQGRLEGIMTDSAIKRMGVGNIRPRSPARLPQRRSSSALAQFGILTSRTMKILVRDRFSLVLMLAISPIIALINFIISGATGRNPWDYVYGNFPGVILAAFILPIFAVMVGSLSFMREFVKEADIYKRERLVNLRIIPYVMSKVVVAALFALYQALTYVVVHYLAFDVPGGIDQVPAVYITVVLAAVAGMMMGLLASALAPNANSTPLILIIFLIPQFLLAGAFVKLPSLVTAPVSARWGYEVMMSIGGAGSDVIRDPCWAMEKPVRDKLTPDQEAEFGCNCSGLNALKQESCDFPGLGQFYTKELDEPEPESPPTPAPPPSEPVFPAPPPEPSNPADPMAGAAYMQQLKAFNAEVERMRNAYKLAMDAYQADMKRYQERAVAYERSKAEWEIARNAAVAKAEGIIDPMYRDQSWTFADKRQPEAYYGKLITDWLAQGAIIFTAFIAILLLFKWKDYTS